MGWGGGHWWGWGVKAQVEKRQVNQEDEQGSEQVEPSKDAK